MHGKKENYIDYISGRPGVALNEGEQHGLFSYPGARINLEQVMDEVANHKGTVWINVVSMKREDAREGFLRKGGLKNLKSSFTNDIFGEELKDIHRMLMVRMCLKADIQLNP